TCYIPVSFCFYNTWNRSVCQLFFPSAVILALSLPLRFPPSQAGCSNGKRSQRPFYPRRIVMYSDFERTTPTTLKVIVAMQTHTPVVTRKKPSISPSAYVMLSFPLGFLYFVFIVA